MNRDPKDALDQAIDEVLASMVAGEPRRVDAASVRKATGDRRAPTLPVWLAAAAMVVLAIGGALFLRTPPGRTPETARQGTAPEPVSLRPIPSATPQQLAKAVATPRPTMKPRVEPVYEPPYEGLPRLVVASIDLPEPIATELLDADALRIEQIEITPLLVSTLPDDPEPKQ